MSDPFRLKVLKAISTSLSEISKADGYHFDFKDSVFRGRLIYGENDPLPMLTIIEPPLPTQTPVAPVAAVTKAKEWDLIVQGFVKDDRENPTDPAHLAMSDVKRKLAAELKRKGTGRNANQYDFFGLNFKADEKGNAGAGAPYLNIVENMSIGSGVVRPPEEGVSTKAYFWLTITLKIVEDNFNPMG